MSIKYNRDLIQQLSKEFDKATDVAKAYAEKEGIYYTESVRKCVNRILLDVRSEFSTETVDYKENSSIPSALKPDGTFMSIDEFCDTYGLDRSDVKSAKLITHSNKNTYNIAFHSRFKTEDISEKILYDRVVETLNGSGPKATDISPVKKTGRYCLVIDPADVHIGKLAAAYQTGDSYNSATAVQRVVEGVSGILSHASSYDVDQIVLVIGNDIVHVDGPKNTTTKGTPQDVDGLWWQSAETAINVYKQLITTLRTKANVHIMYNPSNHDYMIGYFVARVLKAYFSNDAGTTWDSDLKHRKYFQFGNNLIGTSHGDGAKMDNLPLLMANDVPKMWGEAPLRYMYIHHFHSKAGKDYPGVTVEAIRSPSGTDNWHHISGYQYAKKAVEGFVHDYENGQVAHFTHLFK